MWSYELGEHQFIEGQHKEECLRFSVPCPNKCDALTVPCEDMKKHRGECKLEVTSCPNDGEGKLKRWYFTSHVEMKCLCHKVDCRYCCSTVVAMLVY